jgi:hypothetical protein
LIDDFHAEIRESIGLADVIDRDYVGMIQVRRCLCLVVKWMNHAEDASGTPMPELISLGPRNDRAVPCFSPVNAPDLSNEF